MSPVVKKFGGTSVANTDRLRAVAKRVVAAKRAGEAVVVVVSAMAKETDRLLALAGSFAPRLDTPEADVIASTGEMLSAGLLALAIQAEGARSRSFLGFQLPILTSSAPGRARVLKINTDSLLEALAKGEIPVVAGFQGIDTHGRLTTLGRGGSDTTAVALAAALGGRCEIYTDVKGVCSADPRLCPDAVVLRQVSYEFMLEAAELGANVMHDRSVELGMLSRVPIAVGHAFESTLGTLISESDPPVSCVTLDKSLEPLPQSRDLARVSVIGKAAHLESLGAPEYLTALDRHQIRCAGFYRGKRSLSFLIAERQAVDTVQLFHSLFSSHRQEALACTR